MSTNPSYYYFYYEQVASVSPLRVYARLAVCTPASKPCACRVRPQPVCSRLSPRNLFQYLPFPSGYAGTFSWQQLVVFFFFLRSNTLQRARREQVLWYFLARISLQISRTQQSPPGFPPRFSRSLFSIPAARCLAGSLEVWRRGVLSRVSYERVTAPLFYFDPHLCHDSFSQTR